MPDKPRAPQPQVVLELMERVAKGASAHFDMNELADALWNDFGQAKGLSQEILHQYKTNPNDGKAAKLGILEKLMDLFKTVHESNVRTKAAQTEEPDVEALAPYLADYLSKHGISLTPDAGAGKPTHGAVGASDNSQVDARQPAGNPIGQTAVEAGAKDHSGVCGEPE
jgi:hypothetical protein